MYYVLTHTSFVTQVCPSLRAFGFPFDENLFWHRIPEYPPFLRCKEKVQKKQKKKKITNLQENIHNLRKPQLLTKKKRKPPKRFHSTPIC
jgi:hypothetical protein